MSACRRATRPLERVRLTRLAVALALGMLVPACGPSASDPYNGLASYRPPGNEYVLRYLAPPWRVDRSAGTTIRLIIERDGTRGIDGGGLIVIPKYMLDVSVAAGTARALADADVAALPGAGETLIAGPRPIATDSGDLGFDVVARGALPGARSRRYVSLDSVRGGAVRLVFEANPDLDDPEVAQMIRHCDVAPEAP